MAASLTVPQVLELLRHFADAFSDSLIEVALAFRGQSCTFTGDQVADFLTIIAANTRPADDVFQSPEADDA